MNNLSDTATPVSGLNCIRGARNAMLPTVVDVKPCITVHGAKGKSYEDHFLSRIEMLLACTSFLVYFPMVQGSGKQLKFHIKLCNTVVNSLS